MNQCPVCGKRVKGKSNYRLFNVPAHKRCIGQAVDNNPQFTDTLDFKDQSAVMQEELLNMIAKQPLITEIEL